jgi:hypothetical protein
MLGFIILLFLFITAWVGILSLADIEEIKKNWPKYRCRPSIMPFASFYGHDTAENFNFCLTNMFNAEIGGALGPVFMILGSIVNTLIILIQVANSIRIQFATMMGGVNNLFQNFADRFKQLVATIQMSAYRMKLLMGRLYGAFFAMIYMSIAGMASMQNFTDSILFDFLDTFCFDPDTLVEIEGKGLTKVKDVVIGDVFTKTGSQVTSTFQFEADGQPMVKLPGNILVSTNHYVYFLGKWVQAKDHPLAEAQPAWNGGSERPLICFNTSDHKIPIGSFVFLDYDETEEADQETMKWIDKALNTKTTHQERNFDYTSCVSRGTEIRMNDGSTKPIEEIRLGEWVSTGKVIGVVKKEGKEYCQVPTSRGECVTPGLSFWKTNQWVRAGDVLPIQRALSNSVFYNLIVMKAACYETKDGTFVRDYVEVHSPEAEQFYAEKVERDFKPSSVLAEWAY